MKCCICGSIIRPQPISGWDKGHNPWPISDEIEDRCCDSCNTTIVVPTRIKMHFARKEIHQKGTENEDGREVHPG